VEAAAKALVDRTEELDLKISGSFLSHDGSIIPW
jgi:hypothetical protein